MPNPLEMLERPKFKNSPFGDSDWMGRTSIASGAASADVTCAQVSSDSVISLSKTSFTNSNSGDYRACDVKSINPGVGFVVGTEDGAGFGTGVVIHWMVLRTA